MRRLLLLASVVVLVDVAFFTAITPLLPGYVDDLGLSKAAAGILIASYAVGALLGALPAGLMAARVGPRPTLIAGLALLGVSSLGFGFAESIVLLDVARFVQGLSSALTWSGAFTWLILAAAAGRRGEMIGTALGAAVAGALVGPALGGLAAEVGPEAVFASVVVFSAVLIAIALRLPPPAAERDRQPVSAALEALLRPQVARASFLVALPSMIFGVVAVVVPLRIDDLGGGAGVVAAGFIAGAALEAVIAPLAGRRSDRVGRRSPVAVGFAVCAVGLAGVPAFAAIGGVIAAVIVLSVGAGICFSPVMAMLSDAAEETGLHQGYASGLVSMAWAVGEIAGSAGGGAAAGAVGYAIPCLVLAAGLLAAALVLRPGEEAAPGPVSAAKAD
jgi:MFS family permease